MASTAGYNNKNAPVHSSTFPNCGTYVQAGTPLATQVDATTGPRHHAPPSDQGAKQSTNEWKISFCGCCSAPAHCCGAFFFPCGNAVYAAHHTGWSGVAIGLIFFVTYVGVVSLTWYSAVVQCVDKSNYDCSFRTYSTTTRTFTGWTTTAFGLGLVFIVATAMLRGAVRTFDKIPGTCGNDLCASCWCSCCVLSQMSAHTERVKPLRAADASTLPSFNFV